MLDNLNTATLALAIREVHEELQPREVGKARAVAVVIDRLSLSPEWEVPLRALCTGAGAPEVFRWAKGEKR